MNRGKPLPQLNLSSSVSPYISGPRSQVLPTTPLSGLCPRAAPAPHASVRCSKCAWYCGRGRLPNLHTAMAQLSCLPVPLFFWQKSYGGSSMTKARLGKAASSGAICSQMGWVGVGTVFPWGSGTRGLGSWALCCPAARCLHTSLNSGFPVVGSHGAGKGRSWLSCLAGTRRGH